VLGNYCICWVALASTHCTTEGAPGDESTAAFQLKPSPCRVKFWRNPASTEFAIDREDARGPDLTERNEVPS
jgi:hypothetical protein